MAFAQSGNTVTQTGTDIGLTAFDDVAGVTSYTEAGTTTYVVADTANVIVTGKVFQNTETERVYWSRSAGSFYINGGEWWHGVPRFGTVVTALTAVSSADEGDIEMLTTDSTVYRFNGTAWVALTDDELVSLIWSPGQGMYFNANDRWWNQSTDGNPDAGAGAQIQVANDGVLAINGSTISGRIHMSTYDTATIYNRAPAQIAITGFDNTGAGNTNAANLQNYLTRLQGGVFDVRNLSINGGGFSMQGAAISGANTIDPGDYNITLARSNGSIGYFNQVQVQLDPSTRSTIPILRNTLFSANIVDAVCWSGAGTTTPGLVIIDSGSGSATNINGYDPTAPQNDCGYVIDCRSIETVMTREPLASEIAGGTAADTVLDVSGMIYCTDSNNTAAGNSRTPTRAHASLTDTADSVYTFEFDGGISSRTLTGGSGATCINTIDENLILLSVTNVTKNGGTTNDSTPYNTGIWKKDIRSTTGIIGNDVFDFDFWTYENGYFRLSPDLALGGNTGHIFNGLRSLDPAITSTKAQAQVLSDTTFGSSLTYTAAGFTSTASITLDQLYDIIAYDKATDTARRNVPSVTTKLIISDGTTIDFGTLTVTLPSTAFISAGVTNTGVSHDTALDLDNFNLAGLSVTAPTLTNLPDTIPAGAVLSGTYSTAVDQTITIEDGADVSGLTLQVTAGAVFTINNAVAGDFASVPATTVFPYNTTFVIDREADLTIRLSTGTYLNYTGVSSQIVSSTDLPTGTHRAVASIAGVQGNPIEFTISAASTVSLTTFDLAAVGYSDTVVIGSTRTFAKVTYEGRQTIQSTETGDNDYLTTNNRSVKWFGDLYGETVFREVILDNFALTENTTVISLNAANNVTSINLPLIRALHGSGVGGELMFQADPAGAVAIDAAYRMTDGINRTVNTAPGSGVSAEVSNVGLLTGTISATGDRIINTVNANTDFETSNISDEIDALETQVGNIGRSITGG